MNITVNINGVDYEGNVEPIVKDNIPEITPQEQTGFERVNKREEYYSPLISERNLSFREDCDSVDDAHFKSGNYINTKELAIDYQRAFQLFFNCHVGKLSTIPCLT